MLTATRYLLTPHQLRELLPSDHGPMACDPTSAPQTRFPISTKDLHGSRRNVHPSQETFCLSLEQDKGEGW